ncbi:MAG: hypothetical protein RIS79_3061 [Verrucomicrobiota bacterium]
MAAGIADHLAVLQPLHRAAVVAMIGLIDPFDTRPAAGTGALRMLGNPFKPHLGSGQLDKLTCIDAQLFLALFLNNARIGATLQIIGVECPLEHEPFQVGVVHV